MKKHTLNALNGAKSATNICLKTLFLPIAANTNTFANSLAKVLIDCQNERERERVKTPQKS